MASQSAYQFDVYISHSPDDEEWVDGWLLPRLEAAGLRVYVHYRDSQPGASRQSNIERGMKGSRRTVAVVTPAWLASEWNLFEDTLVRSLDPAALRRRLIPLKLKECELPESLAALESIDLTAERRWEQGISRLRRDLEDIVPVPAPWRQDPGAPLWTRWRRWLRRYRREVFWGVAGAGLVGAVLFSFLGWWPFQDRLVWTAEALDAPFGWVVHITGVALIVGARNPLEGCDHPHKGLWQRPLADPDAWQDSDVGDLLCIPNRDALSDIQAITSLPSEPTRVFVLTSHSGVLVSEDDGAHFEHYAVGPPVETDNVPNLLVIDGSDESSALWAAGRERGLFRFADGEWSRLDQPGGCDGLPGELAVTALATDGKRLLVGTNRRGLWISDDGGQSCRQVFDPAGDYQFRDLLPVPGSARPRYLALVRDWRLEPGGSLGAHQLLDLCPRADSCNSDQWRSDSTPEWDGSSAVSDVIVQVGRSGEAEWYLSTALGGVWRGGLSGEQPERLPGIPRCVVICEVRLASVGPGSAPYLLAAAQRAGLPTVLAPGRHYSLTDGPWWARIWP
ncbi:MAG TPA: toll/interleukin-1 receptor domain-containing protein [Anaerolineae bacterium]|nr:toll/interleukin-1 receptor domain-containing protein [Anaerolineae bacterium]HNU02788.1 toll/interleukin-1 receptor domain-containing protein [Anaerolineae bacterium]